MEVAFLSTSLPQLAGIFLLTILLLYLRSLAAWHARSRGLPLPPGPKPLPIVDNMFDWPQTNQWVVFRDMCAQYGEQARLYKLYRRYEFVSFTGDILHLKILGQHMVVLGSPEAILELLEKRSANTSDRQQVPLMALLVFRYRFWTRKISTDRIVSTRIDASFSAMPYGQWWRRHKRAFWQHFNPGAIPSYQPIQRSGARRFLKKLLKAPADLREHIRLSVPMLKRRVISLSDTWFFVTAHFPEPSSKWYLASTSRMTRTRSWPS